MNYPLHKIEDITLEQLAGICDHTFLNRSEAYKEKVTSNQSPKRLREQAFEKFLVEAVSNRLLIPYAICVRPEDVEKTMNYVKSYAGGKILVASVVGFPDGSVYSTDFKIMETELAIDCGAKEIDMVLNYDALKSGNYRGAERDVSAVVNVAHNNDAIVKLILETSELDKNQIISACDIANYVGCDFIKTSTGYSAYGATYDALKIMKDHFDGGIKMSGGIKTFDQAKTLLHALSANNDGHIVLDPNTIRIGESGLLSIKF